MLKRIKIIVITLLLVMSLAIFFGAGCALGTVNPSSADLGLDVVDDAWHIIFEEYVEKDKLDASAMSQAAIKGMVEALNDPYTSYMSPTILKMTQSSVEGKYEGIGAWVGVKDSQITIISPMPDSPAEKAGIRAGDVILEVDGLSTVEMSLDEAVLHILGPKGTPVTLLILHEGEDEAEEIEVIRDEIKLASLYFEIKEDIAYINISAFSEQTDEELIEILEELPLEEATGIILDLRGNSGGPIDAVVDVTSHFLKEGVIVIVRYTEGEQDSYPVKESAIKTDLPLVVLVDKGSASASEILAGALQDYGRATIVGETTYGKGSANLLFELKDGSGLYITIARWLTPNGRLIEGEGIKPDYPLDLEREDAIQWAIEYLKGNKE